MAQLLSPPSVLDDRDELLHLVLQHLGQDPPLEAEGLGDDLRGDGDVLHGDAFRTEVEMGTLKKAKKFNSVGFAHLLDVVPADVPGAAEFLSKHLEELVVVLARALHLLVDYLTHVLQSRKIK